MQRLRSKVLWVFPLEQKLYCEHFVNCCCLIDFLGWPIDIISIHTFLREEQPHVCNIQMIYISFKSATDVNPGYNQFKHRGLLSYLVAVDVVLLPAPLVWTLSVLRTKIFVPFTLEVVQLLIRSNASSSSPSVSPSLCICLSPSCLEFDLRVFFLQRAEVLIGSQDNSSPPTVIPCWNLADWHWEGHPCVSVTVYVCVSVSEYTCVQKCVLSTYGILLYRKRNMGLMNLNTHRKSNPQTLCKITYWSLEWEIPILKSCTVLLLIFGVEWSTFQELFHDLFPFWSSPQTGKK